MDACACRVLFVLTVSWLLSGCAAQMAGGSECGVEPGYFGDLRRFAWANTPSITVYDDTGYISPLTIAGLKSSIVEHLSAKGFELTDDAGSADFVLDVSLSTRRELKSVTYPPISDVDRWETIEMTDGARFDLRTVGFMSVDAFVDGVPVWRGWVERDLYPKDRDRSNLVIGAAVPKVFEAFPP